MDDIDRQMIALLRVNARLPLTRLAAALGIARSTAQLRLKALEDSGAITGYTLSLAAPRADNRIRAIIMMSVDQRHEGEVIRQLARRHQFNRIYSVSGRYDLCGMLDTENTAELDAVIDRIRAIEGVNETFSTIVLATKLDRPE